LRLYVGQNPIYLVKKENPIENQSVNERN
jgi:hypothetical protein